MRKTVLLLLGLTMAFIGGCILPSFGKCEYWGEIHGQVTTPDGIPIKDLTVSVQYGDMSEKPDEIPVHISNTTQTDDNGLFATKPLQHRYYLVFTHGDPGEIPSPPWDTNGNVYLHINSKSENLNILIWWSRFFYSGENTITFNFTSEYKNFPDDIIMEKRLEKLPVEEIDIPINMNSENIIIKTKHMHIKLDAEIIRYLTNGTYNRIYSLKYLRFFGRISPAGDYLPPSINSLTN